MCDYLEQKDISMFASSPTWRRLHYNDKLLWVGAALLLGGDGKT